MNYHNVKKIYQGGVTIGYLFLFIVIVSEVLAMAIAKTAAVDNNFLFYLLRYLLVIFYHTVLFFALKTIDVTIAYVLWSGLGIILMTFVGMLYFNEKLNIFQMASIGMIIFGIIGLHLGKNL